MRLREITAPSSHPYVTNLRLDPADVAKFERMFEERSEVRILYVDDAEPDLWTLHLGCASDEVARRIEDGWA